MCRASAGGSGELGRRQGVSAIVFDTAALVLSETK